MPQPKIFREEALAYQRGGVRTHGDLLRLSPRWMNSAYWLLVAVLAAGSVYIVFGTTTEYATGVAVIRDQGRLTVAAAVGGLITEVAVQPGEHVQANQLLLRFNDVQEQIESARLNQEFTLQQINRLKNPNDASAQQQLAAIRAQMEAAAQRLKGRTIVASSAGVVSDVRIRPQQLIAAGELLLTLAGDDDALTILAIVPGHYRPLLKAGDPLRLELNGFRFAYQNVLIESVGNEVIGPNEMRRFLGQDVADSLALQGSSIIVQARLPSRQFMAGGRRREIHDGMTGAVEARVRSERIVLALVPGLKAVFGGGDD